HPDAAVVGPRLLNPDGSLQRSVRAFPTLWRLATEYLFLRKLAPRSRLLNTFYEGGFDHDQVREADWLFGACLLVRRDAAAGVRLRLLLFRGERRRSYREAARWLSSGNAGSLLRSR